MLLIFEMRIFKDVIYFVLKIEGPENEDFIKFYKKIFSRLHELS